MLRFPGKPAVMSIVSRQPGTGVAGDFGTFWNDHRIGPSQSRALHRLLLASA